MKITVNNYDIFIKNNIIDELETYINTIYKNKNIFIITDDIVSNLYIEKIKLPNYNIKVITIKNGEKNKNLETYSYIINELLNSNITRDSLIIAFGGGVVGDIAGFVASTILRGVKYISIPTTLLSQVDSSIGGKTALNINNTKNMIGTFYEPSLVLIDPILLSTLTLEDYNNGLGEIIKTSLIHNKDIIPLLKDKSNIGEVIYLSLLSKKYYVEKDLYDTNERMILNFGHTFGHVIELEKNIKHGLAVIDGMIMSLKYGIDLEITNPYVLDELYNILKSLNINYSIIDYKKYLSKLNNDKKKLEGNINFIFLKDINKPIIKQIKY